MESRYLKIFFGISFLFGICNGHAIMNFLTVLSNGDGVTPPSNYSTSSETTIYFTFKDLNTFEVVHLNQMMKHHARYVHVLLVSYDLSWAAHTHPDDFMDLENAPSNTSVFFVKTTFPRSGWYSIGFSFMFDDMQKNTLTEGFSYWSFGVHGSPAQQDISSEQFDLTARNKFNSYPIGMDEIFDSWINVDTNLNSNGYTGIFQVAPYEMLMPNNMSMNGMNGGMNGGMGGMNGSLVMLNSTHNINVTAGQCTFFYLNILTNDTMDGAMLVPYLDAAVHFTIAADDGSVYHAHGTYLPEGLTFPNLVQSMKSMNMGMMNMSDPMYNVSMNAMMIGVTTNGTVSCNQDPGKVMKMMNMDMNMFYGPPTFSTVAGIFDFPGSGVWSIYAYVKVMLPNGEERLLVPHFTVTAQYPYIAPMNSESMEMSMSSSAALIPQLFIGFLMLYFVF